MLSKTWYNLHSYIDSDFKKHDFSLLYCTRAGTDWLCQHTSHVCNLFSIDFVKKSRFECCFWSAQCIETQARTSDIGKTWVFISLNVQWLSLKDNIVFCNVLRSIKAAHLELEKQCSLAQVLFPMFTIITPGPYTHSKQSKAFHAKCYLKVNCEKKWVW